MKKALAICALLAMLVVPSMAFADPLGIYVAPKFVYGFTQVDSVKAHIWDDTDSVKGNMGSFDDHAFGGSIAVGYNFKKNFQIPLRLELDYAIFSDVKGSAGSSGQNWETTKASYGIQTLFANAYFDIDTGTQFTPYITAGLGAAFINNKTSTSGYDATDAYGWSGSTPGKVNTNFAWNVGLGLGYDIDSNWSLDLGYRFVGLGKVRSADGDLTIDGFNFSYYTKAKSLYMHQIFAGVRYTF